MSNKQKNEVKDEKICFVIMPIADMDGYDAGHFSRVYNFLIKPACESAGFKAIRADEVSNSNYIIVDILHKILDSGMVLCDLSGRNPNVLYELGVRQAFNLPTVLIKDMETTNIFDIQGLRYTEYSQSLRVDEVARDLNKIEKAIRETEGSGAKDVNSLIQLLSVRPAVRPSDVELSNDTSVILAALDGLGSRISNLESNQMILAPKKYGGSETLARALMKSKEFSGEMLRKSRDFEKFVGEDMYIEGNKIGTLIGVSPSGITIDAGGGKLVDFKPSDSRFDLISPIPF